VVERYAYDPYGKATVLDASGAPKTDPNWSEYGNPWTFTGRSLDGETAIIYYRWRMNDPSLGRFIGRDPIAQADKSLDHASLLRTKQTRSLNASCNMCLGQDDFLGPLRTRPIDLSTGALQALALAQLRNTYIYGNAHPMQALDPEGLSPWCGPDITEALKRLATDVTNEFNSHWRISQSWGLCTAFGMNSWDIYTLVWHNAVLPPQCPSGHPNCENTVEMFGACIKNDEANYFLWGLMNRLCNYTKVSTLGNIWLWKSLAYGHGGTPGTYFAAAVGYNFGNKAGMVPPQTPPCCLGCGRFKGRLTWHWAGVSNK
jgi:RHS repeat-associated protein